MINNVSKNDSYKYEVNTHAKDIQRFYASKDPVKTPVGQMFQIKQSEINSTNFLHQQNLWFIIILEVFAYLAVDCKFLELRPTPFFK